MEWIEIASSDVETAKRIALEELGIREQEAEFEILAEEKPAFSAELKPKPESGLELNQGVLGASRADSSEIPRETTRAGQALPRNHQGKPAVKIQRIREETWNLSKPK